MAADQKISVYSTSELKNTSDDALPNYLDSLKFKQSHFYSDVRLIIGYTSVAVGAGAFYFDYTRSWEETKGATLWAVLLYFVLNGALSYWLFMVEKGVVYVGELNGSKLVIRTRVEKYDPTYFVTVESSSNAGGSPQVSHLRTPFSRWFDSDGRFVALPFQQWLASNIPLIGSADRVRLNNLAAKKDSIDQAENAGTVRDRQGVSSTKKRSKKG
ncbi:MAG: hypothetical protein M1825_002293 [Sarcosagium campestre]|nr:MAG: hypothetical protein M1825_002293 [Sarcosagium campestre]